MYQTNKLSLIPYIVHDIIVHHDNIDKIFNIVDAFFMLFVFLLIINIDFIYSIVTGMSANGQKVSFYPYRR